MTSAYALYLVAHKARGELALDVAQHETCPICSGRTTGPDQMPAPQCSSCDGDGLWWFAATSQQRIYPFWAHPIDELYSGPEHGTLSIREMIGRDDCPRRAKDCAHEYDPPATRG